MATETFSLTAMFMIGLMGSGHCIGMCGGISGVLGLGTTSGKSYLVYSYHLGRIFSYSLAGALIGVLGLWGREYLALGPWLRLAGGVMLILMGLYMADWWRALTALERLGGHLWKRIQPISKRLLPVDNFRQGFGLGFLWGWLPCGLVYSALVYSATPGNPLQSGLMMAAFGLGTTPAVLFSSAFSGQLKLFLQRKGIRMALALMLIVFGAWTGWQALSHLNMAQGQTAEHIHHH